MIKIKRDWAGRPTGISFDGNESSGFVLIFKDNANYWNIENRLDVDDIPPVLGMFELFKNNLIKTHDEEMKKKNEFQTRAVITPRDAWDGYTDIDKRLHPDKVYSPSEDVKDKIEEEEDDFGKDIEQQDK